MRCWTWGFGWVGGWREEETYVSATHAVQGAGQEDTGAGGTQPVEERGEESGWVGGWVGG